MDQTNPVELTLLFLRILEFLQQKAYIRKTDKKTILGNGKKVIWRLNIDISVYREPVRR